MEQNGGATARDAASVNFGLAGSRASSIGSPSAKSNGHSRKRERSSDVDEHNEHVKKRACNECRQQKVSRASCKHMESN